MLGPVLPASGAPLQQTKSAVKQGAAHRQAQSSTGPRAVPSAGARKAAVGACDQQMAGRPRRSATWQQPFWQCLLPLCNQQLVHRCCAAGSINIKSLACRSLKLPALNMLKV